MMKLESIPMNLNIYRKSDPKKFGKSILVQIVNKNNQLERNLNQTNLFRFLLTISISSRSTSNFRIRCGLYITQKMHYSIVLLLQAYQQDVSNLPNQQIALCHHSPLLLSRPKTTKVIKSAQPHITHILQIGRASCRERVCR